MKAQLNALWRRSDSEVDLFRKIKGILSLKHNIAFIAETHQHSITYFSKTVGQIARRELSDLWIIAFSPSLNRIRTTFLQAKYHRKNILPQRKFYADFFQYELLSTKAPLISGSSFNFPTDCLSFSCCGSIGSYGVFYIDSTSSINMAYSSANVLTAATKPTTYGQKPVDIVFPTSPISFTYCPCKMCSELNYTYDIDCFTKNLLQLNIGGELLHKHQKILSYIKLILSKNSNNSTVSQLVTVIDNINILGDTVDLDIGIRGNPNILIINVDEKASR